MSGWGPCKNCGSMTDSGVCSSECADILDAKKDEQHESEGHPCSICPRPCDCGQPNDCQRCIACYQEGRA